MKLNIVQKGVVLTALIVIVVMTVYPPWVVFYTSLAGPYAPIWLPPELARFIDLYRLAIQYGAVLIVAGGLCLVLRR